jgi:hypothetical protein
MPTIVQLPSGRFGHLPASKTSVIRKSLTANPKLSAGR